MGHRLAAAVAAVLFCAPGATLAADGPGKALKDFGLAGEWAKDCAAATSAGNNRTVYEAAADGSARLTYRLGASGENVYLIKTAKPLSKVLILLDEENDFGDPYQVTVALEAGRIRVMESRDPSNGRVYVAGGVIQGNGRETAWETRCR